MACSDDSSTSNGGSSGASGGQLGDAGDAGGVSTAGTVAGASSGAGVVASTAGTSVDDDDDDDADGGGSVDCAAQAKEWGGGGPFEEKAYLDPGTGETLGNVVVDKTNGLVWYQYAAVELNRAAAVAYCRNFNAAGHTDWRLPTREELQGILVQGPGTAAFSKAAAAFQSLGSVELWSSSPYDCATGYFWSVSLPAGQGAGQDPALPLDVVCVYQGM